MSKDNVHFEDQSKLQATFNFRHRILYQRKKTCTLHFYWFIKTLVEVWENLKGNIHMSARIPRAFLAPPTSTHVSIKQLDYELEISIMHRN